MDADTIHSIAQLAQEADHNGELTSNVTLQDGQVFTYRNNPTEYGRELGEILSPPRVSVLQVGTLTGFCDALEAGAYKRPTDYFIHVENYLNVALKERTVDAWGQRTTHIQATHTPIDAFKFDQYYADPQKFIIALQVAFLQTEELLYLTRLASNQKTGNTVHTQDDGFSQTVTVKTGEISTAEVKVKPRIKLIPLRTFPEAAPVESEYLIRFQQTPQQAPSIALFDCEGKKWQAELMISVKRWLADKVDAGIPVIA